MNAALRLQDVADRAGVSRATVSLALRHHSSIPAVTRLRLQKLADEMGYRPNPLVAALMRYQRSGRTLSPTHLTLALVLKFSRRDEWQRYLSPNLITGAQQRAQQLGYHLEEFWLTDLGWSDARLSEVLFHRNVPGIIVGPLPVPVGQLRLAWEKFSAVAIGYSLARPNLHRVTSDRFQALQLAMREVRRQGYRRIGLALETNQDARVHHQWVAAFLWEQSQCRLADRIPLLLVGDRGGGARRFAEWLGEFQPEVVLGYDAKAAGWLQSLDPLNRRKVQFVQLWKENPAGKYAGLYHHPAAIGAAAVDSVVGLIQRNERGIPASAHTVQLEASWSDAGAIGGL